MMYLLQTLCSANFASPEGKCVKNPSPFSNDGTSTHGTPRKFQMTCISPIDQSTDVDDEDIIFFQIENFKWSRSRKSRSAPSLEKGEGGFDQNKEGKRRSCSVFMKRSQYIIFFSCADCSTAPSCTRVPCRRFVLVFRVVAPECKNPVVRRSTVLACAHTHTQPYAERTAHQASGTGIHTLPFPQNSHVQETRLNRETHRDGACIPAPADRSSVCTGRSGVEIYSKSANRRGATHNAPLRFADLGQISLPAAPGSACTGCGVEI